MISKNKKRINITLDRVELEAIQAAAASWGITVSDYLAGLARYDMRYGLTFQAREMSGYSGGEYNDAE